MAYIYRCNRCRTRNTFNHSIDWYKVLRKCRDCGHKKFYLDKERTRRVACTCPGAYFWGSHRAGAACCEKNPNHLFNRAVRDGADPSELAFAGLGLKTVEGDEPPF